jgi:hypothetical protein
MDESPSTGVEERAYGAVVRAGTVAGLGTLLVTFFVYVCGFAQPHVPLDRIVGLSRDDVRTYQTNTDAPQGWAWVRMLEYSDYLNYIGIAILGGTTLAAFLVIVPLFVRRRDWIYAAIAAIEICVLAVAASGLLGSGH